MLIKNAAGLIANGSSTKERRARALCLASLEAGLAAADPNKMMMRTLRLSGDSLLVQGTRIRLGRFRRILVIGGGKASGGMAEAVESLLGAKISGGVVNLPAELVSRYETSRVELHGATHPFPSERGTAGVRKMLDLVDGPTEETLAICLLSGGGSALMPLPRDGMRLDDKVKVTELLLKAGATIQEVNVVRKHL
jgi:glycerate 2-kinase